MKIKIEKEVEVSEYQIQLFEKGKETIERVKTLLQLSLSPIQNDFDMIRSGMDTEEFLTATSEAIKNLNEQYSTVNKLIENHYRNIIDLLNTVWSNTKIESAEKREE